MLRKQILFHCAACENPLHNPSLLTDAIRVVLGPKSKSVLFQK